MSILIFLLSSIFLSLTLINYKNICHSGRFPHFNSWVPDVAGMIKTNGFMFQVSNFYGHLAIITHLNLGVKFLMKIKIWANMCAMLWLSKLTFCQTNAQKPDDFHKQIRGITPFFTQQMYLELKLYPHWLTDSTVNITAVFWFADCFTMIKIGHIVNRASTRTM